MRFLLLAALGLLSVPASAQTARAITQDGRVIDVHDDGTWTLVQPADGSDAAPPPPPPPAPPASVTSRTLESASGRYAIEYDPSRWTRTPGANPDAEFELTLPFSAAAALTIYEAFPMTTKELRDVVIANARAGTASGVEVLSERTVRVPGGSGLQVEFEGVAENGVRFVFVTSVFGDDRGALQVTTYTSASNRDRHRAEMLRFHDGVRLLDKGGE